MIQFFQKTFFISMAYIILTENALAAGVPDINCGALPCPEKTETFSIIWTLIATWIKYVAVLAVLAVMVWGIMYLISSGQEEKTKKAKSVIIWALVWVFISVMAWSLINIINNFIIF